MTTLRLGLPLFALLAVPACDSGASSGPTGAARRADVAALCDAICERGLRCADEEPPPEQANCQPECLSKSAEPSLLRADILRGLAECQSELACGENDDGCLERVVAELVPDYRSSPLLQRCIDVQDQCNGFSDDDCSYAVIFTDAGKQRLEACLSQSCSSVGACMAGLKSTD